MAKYAYAGDPVGQALGNHEATEAAPALTVDEAADIMGEVMIREMHYYSNGLAAVRSAAGRTPTQELT